MIDVAEEKVQRVHVLRKSRFQAIPLMRRNDAWHEIERNEAFGAALFAIHGERDADTTKKPLGLVALLRDSIGRVRSSQSANGRQ